MGKTTIEFGEVETLTKEVHRAAAEVTKGGAAWTGAPSTGWVGGSRVTFHNGVPHASTVPTVSAFGNTGAASACMSAYQQAESAMRGVMTAFGNTLDSDAERLELVVALFRQVDAEAADRMLQANRNRLDVFSAHLDTGHGDGGDARRARQIDRLLGLTGNSPAGAGTVVAGDFNSLSTDGSQSAQAIRRYGTQGFDVNQGDIHDGRGGTSASHRRIDHLMPRGLGASEATRWDRGQSDHDGQVVDVTLPGW
jgi:hypothetical protein